jgi:ATP-dependent DNA helicase RecQ
VRAWGARPAWVAAVPSRRPGDPVTDFARRLAAALGLPFERLVERVADTPPQREMANSAQQVANVRGAFAVAGEAPPGACLLVDDVRFSGWTLAMVAGRLRRRGSGPVHPLALTSAY